MKRSVLYLLLGWLLAGCGRIITPTPVPTFTEEAIPVTEVTKPIPTSRPTSTPRIATPIATPTPTITPTPIIYTIQPGDTLLKVAIQFNRSTESIQEINGIVDPRFLQIGQTVIIPPAEENPDSPPSPTPTPFPLNVTAINFQTTRQGALWCMGMVVNPSSVSLTEIVIEVSLLDSNGVLLAREATFTQLDVIQSGQSAPFAVLFDSPPSNFAQYQVVAVSAVPWSDQTRYYFELETFDLRGSPEGIATYRVSGQLRNRGILDAEAIRLVVITYDKDDKLLAQRQAELAVNVLRAGATTPFEIDLIIPQGVVDHFEVLAQGLRTE